MGPMKIAGRLLRVAAGSGGRLAAARSALAAAGRIGGFGRSGEHTVGQVTGTETGTEQGSVRRVRAGGVWLAYRTWGAAQAPALVLLHALGESSSDWAPVAEALAAGWRVHAPDLRGHGASDWTGPYTIEQLAADLAAFLDALGLDRVALGGHSIGGAPAYLLRGTAPWPGRPARARGARAAVAAGTPRSR